MKKLISSVLVVILLFNFISANILRSYATGAESEKEKTSMQNSMTEQNAPISNDAATDILEEGEASRVTGNTDKTTTTVESVGTTMLGFVLGILALLVDLLVFSVDIVMGMLTYTTEYDNSGTADFQFFFSLERTVFNRVPLFNVNYFDIKDNPDETYIVGTEGDARSKTIQISSSINDIKKQVSLMYQITRIIALMISLVILIYIGIRMAISTTASEKADYKRMLIAWIESIVLLFAMIYIMSAIMALGESLVNLFYNIEQNLLGSGTTEVFEETIRDQILSSIGVLTGMELTIWSIMYWVLLFTEIKFFWLYLKRVLMVGFLIVISPFITVTYAIDKVGDGKAQSFFVWFKEFIVNVLIQPLHALIYLVFILTANELSKKAPLLALAFLMSMGTVERMVKVIFNLRGLVTLRGINKFLKKE